MGRLKPVSYYFTLVFVCFVGLHGSLRYVAVVSKTGLTWVVVQRCW